CGAVVVARARVAAYGDQTFVPFKLALAQAERADCRRNGRAFAVRVGMSDAEVAALAGAPVPWRSGPQCWLYRAIRPGTAIDGASGVTGTVARFLGREHQALQGRRERAWLAATGTTEDAAARSVIAGQGPGERCRLHH
ncbi:MAG: hypothetical protein ACYDCH_09680, partial [Gaiellaceae bacterium]